VPKLYLGMEFALKMEAAWRIGASTLIDFLRHKN
jgi:hypothetical protein